jgi:prepilin-type processing-associated H-X9-DG protein
MTYAGTANDPTSIGVGEGWAGQIYPYVKSTAVFTCPDSSASPPAGSTAICYAYNPNLLNMVGNGSWGYTNCCWTPASICNTSRLVAPAMSIAYTEVAGVSVALAAGGETGSPLTNGGQRGTYPSGSKPSTGPLGDTADTANGLDASFLTGRHSDGANYGFWDGHVKWLKCGNVAPGFNAATSIQVESNAGTDWNNGSGTSAALLNGQMPAATYSSR